MKMFFGNVEQCDLPVLVEHYGSGRSPFTRRLGACEFQAEVPIPNGDYMVHAIF
jgi:hypothetical protein